MRFRSIDSSISPVNGNWNIGVKLSYLQIAKVSQSNYEYHM